MSVMLVAPSPCSCPSSSSHSSSTNSKPYLNSSKKISTVQKRNFNGRAPQGDANRLLSHQTASSSNNGFVVVEDDLHALLKILPSDLRENLRNEPKRAELLEVRPGVGKTTVMREIARVLADELHKRVVIVDTSNEIGGDGDIPHAAIGGARRMQVPEPSMQHKIMIEAVENHMPEVIIVDEIGTEAEALACRSIAERGVMLIGTAHGERLENIIKNHILADLIGGVETVTLGDDEARARRSQKSILERKAPPTFPFLIEMRERNYWVTHRTERSVDMLLHGKKPLVEVRKRDDQFRVVTERWKQYDGDGI